MVSPRSPVCQPTARLRSARFWPSKIDNYSIARPQWGLDSADAIIEENVEGVTRFVGLFQTQLPNEVGPVAAVGDL